jgi:hypothetical protein
MRLHALFVLCVAGFLGCACVARAQSLETPRPRSGYYLSFGMAGALNQAWRNSKRLHDLGFGTGSELRFGQLLTRHLGLGLRFGFGGATAGNEQATLGAFGLEGQWEFLPNFALRCGLGLGIATLLDKREIDAKQKGTVGAGYALGLSYDWFLTTSRSGGFAISPALQARFVPGRQVSALTGFVGIELTYWTGLPRDQLALPESEAYQPH